MRLGQPASGEPQLLPRARAGRNLELHRASERRHLDRRAEHGFPGRERQIEKQVVTADAEQPVRAQRDIEIQIAVAPAVRALAPLSGEAQTLAVGRAPGDACLEAALHAARETPLVVLGHLEIEVDLGAAVRLLERDVRGDLVVLPRHAELPARAGAAPPAHDPGEEVGEVEVLERKLPVARVELALAELRVPAGRRPELLAGPVAAETIVGGALLRILERLVGLA